MPYDLEWLFNRQSIKVGLERIHALLERLHHPEREFRSILVGGTNGKGSTSATLERILRESGLKTGLFTSPHLTYFAERFLVSGERFPEQHLLERLEHIGPLAENVGASFFEITTALGCLLFAEAGVEWAVMEVGLGGRFDATNALEPELSIITSIGLDHMNLLGDTEAQIAFEKAGIMRRKRLTLTGAAGEALRVLEREADSKGAELWRLFEEIELETTSEGWNGSSVQVKTRAGELEAVTPLLGEHQARNVALAIAAALALEIDGDAIEAGVAATVWPGRMERLEWRGKFLLLDGAHNPDGARALVTALRDLGVGKVPLIFGVASDKQVEGIARALSPLASEVILTRAVHSPRAAPPTELAKYFPGVPITLTSSPAEALERLPDAALCVVAGSLYLIGEIRPLVLDEVGEARERLQ